MKNKFIIILLGVFFLFNIIGVQASDINVSQQRKAVIETAQAYFRQGTQVQYDSYRKNLYATPEDATIQHYIYTVCSGFTFQSYYQTLGIEIPDTTEELLDYAKANQTNKSNILFYYDTQDEVYSKNVLGTKNSPNYSAFAKQMIEVLEPGDIFVITRSCYDG